MVSFIISRCLRLFSPCITTGTSSSLWIIKMMCLFIILSDKLRDSCIMQTHIVHHVLHHTEHVLVYLRERNIYSCFRRAAISTCRASNSILTRLDILVIGRCSWDTWERWLNHFLSCWILSFGRDLSTAVQSLDVETGRSTPLVNIHLREDGIHHLSKCSFSSISIAGWMRGKMDGVLCFECFH